MTTATAMQTFRCELTRPPMTPNQQRRAHWGAVRLAKVRAQTAVALGARVAHLQPVTEGRVDVAITWHAPTNHRRDPDSLSVFLKAALDQLVRGGVLTDDSSAYVRRTSTEVVVDRADPHIEITLTTVEDA